MDTFLRQVAQDLYSRYAESMNQLTVVFPNKRASIFFNQHLGELMGATPILAPRYTTISELFERLSQKNPADKLLLICHLYQSYVEVTGRADETLDHFFSWGEVMLSDFDDIDKNLVDSSLLMSNIADLEHLTDFSYLSEEQVSTIHTFFHNANLEQKSRLKEEFLTLWDMLHTIYTHFKTRLEAHHIAYEGMLQREVTELLLQPGKDGHGGWPAELSPMLRRHYAFVGFNVLNQTEHHLFRYLKNHATTHFYWDYDKAYMQDFSRMAVADEKNGKPGHLHEAGRFIHDNILRYGNTLSNPSTFDNMGKRPKRIRFIASATENAQAREVTDWLTNRQAADNPFNPREYAIVLCNEGILEPVLHSIPSGSATPPLNVTMGYPLNETALSSFINMVLDMQSQCAGRRDWRFRPVANVLRHPLTRRLCGSTSDTIISRLLKGNIMFPTDDMLQKDEFTSLLFTHPKDKNGLLDYLTALIEHISLRSHTDKGS